MVRITPTAVLALAALVLPALGRPLAHSKRIAQITDLATVPWVSSCEATGVSSQICNALSVQAFSTLLFAASVCDQQNAADKMIDLAKQQSNSTGSANMIRLTQVFMQQPRNTPTSQAVPYCQQPPKNAELNGLYQCQFASANETTFVGGLAAGSPGTVPYGLSAPVQPPGSCHANPAGPVPDGMQLVQMTQDPGVGSAGAGTQGAAASAAPPPPPTPADAPASAAAAPPTQDAQPGSAPSKSKISGADGFPAPNGGSRGGGGNGH